MLFAVTLLAGCGRVGFDPQSGGGDDGPGGDASTGDGTTTPPDTNTTPIDAVDLCARAMTVNVGSTAPLDTCSGEDKMDNCSTGKREVVFKFVPPMSAGYTIRARDAGTQNVSNSTVRLNASCTDRVSGCTGILGTTFSANEPVYFAVEASQGACATIEFEIDAN